LDYSGSFFGVSEKIDMNKFNYDLFRFKFEVKDLDKEIDVDVNSVS